jgi:hypothetical protein
VIEALAILTALYALLFTFIICALSLGRQADLRAQHEMQRKVAGDGEGNPKRHSRERVE